MVNWRGLFGLKSKYIGVVYAPETKEIIAIVNPAYDYELDDPNHLNEEKRMLKLKRGNFPKNATPYYTIKVIEEAKKILGY